MMWRHGARVYDWILEHSKLYGGKPWRIQLLGRPVTVVFNSPDVVEDILKTQFEIFDKGEYTSRAAFDVLGNGIFVADGDLWSHQRKTGSHLFSLQMMRESMEESVRSHCVLLFERLDTIAAKTAAAAGEEANVVEMKRLLDLFTMDVFTKIGFGVDVGGLQGRSSHAFLDAFERSSLALLYRFQQPMWLWPLKKKLNIGVERQLKIDMKVINDTISGIITRSMEERQRGQAQADRRDLIALFLDKPPPESLASTSGGGGMDPALIRDMAMNFIAAGRDTTSQSMAWFLIMMNRYPLVLERVREELDARLPYLRAEKARIPSMEDVQELVYLEAAIRESLRLNPVVAITTRTAMQDTTLVDGTFLRAGTRVVFSNYAMARMTSVWGDDAEQFNPDRWLDPTSGKLVQVSPFKYPVFLGGPRTCLGMKFALMEMKITLAVLLSRYELRTTRDPFSFTYRAAVTMGIRGPLHIRVAARPT
jgi:cytochrome P450